jgi:Surface adhesin CshA non-repetitive domain 2
MKAYLASLWFLLMLFCTTSTLAATCAAAGAPGAAQPGWQTYCWIDFSGYNAAQAESATGQNYSVLLNDGSTLTFNLKSTTGLISKAAPTWSGAAVGNSSFLLIPGQPTLYTNINGQVVDVTISQILITPPSGTTAVTSYAVVAADAESTDGNEYLEFTTNGGNWVILDQVAPITGSTYPTVTNTGTTFRSDGAGNTGNVGAYIVGSSNPTTVTAKLGSGGLQGAMFAVRFASISLNKKIIGTRLDPNDQFDYRITTTTNGTVLAAGTTFGAGNGPFTAAVVSFASGLPITISESMATGSVSTLANYNGRLSCLNPSGSTTVLPNNLTTTSYNFGSLQFGDQVVCTFSNAPFPRVRIAKALKGSRLNAGDQFTVNLKNGTANGAPIIATATTTGAGPTVTTGISPAVLVTPGSPLSFSETASGTTVLANYNASLKCTNSYVGSATVLPTSLLGSVSPTYGDDITCTITNAGLPRLSVSKTLVGTRLLVNDQFTIRIQAGSTTVASATTTGTGASISNGSTPTILAVAGTSYTIDEVGANTTVVANYGPSMNCTNATVGSSTVLTGVFVPTVPSTITPTFGDEITCFLRNRPQPTILVSKALGASRINNTDQFTVRIRSGATTVSSATTTGNNQTVVGGNTGTVFVNSGTTYTIDETAPGTPLSEYNSSLSCINLKLGATTVLPTTVGGTVTPVNGDSIICTITNTPLPRLAINKVLGSSRIADTDQFNVLIQNGATLIIGSTTTGTGSTVSAGSTALTPVVAGIPYTFSELASGTTNLANYTSSMACSNTNTISPTALPSTPGSTITPLLGDRIICTIINTAKKTAATLNVSKASSVISDPINGVTNPKRIPGAIVRYLITVGNAGLGTVDADSLIITDPLLANVNVFASTSSGDPIQFINGTPASGLTYSYASNVSYTNQPGGVGPFTYTPVLDGAGYSSGVTGIRIAPTGTMAASTGAGNPSFTIQFLVRIN